MANVSNAKEKTYAFKNNIRKPDQLPFGKENIMILLSLIFFVIFFLNSKIF